MPDQEIIERVAKAIHDAADWPWASTKEYACLLDHQKELFEKFAISAIKAMREPTEKMVEAAYDIDTGDIERDIWHTMIDSILND